MKIKRVVRKEFDATFVKLGVAVRYDEEDMPNDFPGRSGEMWAVLVNLDDGTLWLDTKTPFPSDASLDLYMKVVDSGCYHLMDAKGESVCPPREYYYVPGFFPGDHYGDYVIFDIAEGRVRNWKKPKPADVQEAFGLNEADE